MTAPPAFPPGDGPIIPGGPEALHGVGDLLGNASGIPAGVLGILHTLLGDLGDFLHIATGIDLKGPISDLVSWHVHLEKLMKLHSHDQVTIPADWWQKLADISIGQFYHGMLEAGLGVDVGKFDNLAKDGVKTVDTMLGFASILPFIVSALSIPAKLLLGERWAERVMEPIAKLPEEMGLTWVIGTVIEQAFEAAVGRSIEEGINQQKRGNRVDFRVLKAVARQGHIKEHDFEKWLAKLGYPEEQIKFIKALDTHQLPLGELVRLYERDKLTRPQFREYLRGLGYVEDDVNKLTTLYIDLAETAAGAMYRSTARALAVSQLITREQYLQVLALTKVPAKEIHDDLAAIDLELSSGRLHSQLSTIRNLYLRGMLHGSQLDKELQQLGYSDQARADLVASWNAGPAPRPLSQAKILSYLVSGVLTDQQATARLIAAGLRAADVPLVIEHAHDTPHTKPRALTTALVTQAYLDGAITYEELEPAYRKAGAEGKILEYLLKTAVFRHSRQRRPAGASIPLNAAEIEDAWLYGLIDIHTALSELEHFGYSKDDALLKLEIKQKGPISFAPPPAPYFSSLEEAIAFLEGEGFHLTPPQDPRILAAEMIVEQAGYIPTPPVVAHFGGGGGHEGP